MKRRGARGSPAPGQWSIFSALLITKKEKGRVKKEEARQQECGNKRAQNIRGAAEEGVGISTAKESGRDTQTYIPPSILTVISGNKRDQTAPAESQFRHHVPGAADATELLERAQVELLDAVLAEVEVRQALQRNYFLI